VQARTVEKAARAKEPARSGPAAAPASAKRKLGFNEQHELKTLPERMRALEGTIAKLQAILADPNLYADKPKRFEEATAALAKAQEELAAAEDRWLALEMLREELSQTG
jgi:ATP-binding cassette subfamily F protein uup